MSTILPRWSAESTDRLLATDDILALGAEEAEDDEDEDEIEEEGDEDENDGYSE
jgi:hypothetical protein